ncbi:MAG: DNA-binding regulatory protein YebC/PmpR family [Candidatus Doudnabacteria bacterium]|nr:DNA-binding regulatory protein YebC/PmpR family [Candidatus Doudnabacteria bacterium]
MSGHSKWAQIKRSKGAADVKKGALFAKLSKQITIAARDGEDPSMNFKLRLAILKARDQSMPSDNIERAIKKGTGAEANAITSLLYEGYGPSGTAFLIEAASDNPNRTFQNVRNIFTKNGGNIGQQGSVGWMFQTKGQLLIERAGDLDAIELAAIDAGASDVRESNEGLEIYTKPEDLEKMKEALEKVNARIAQAEVIKESSQGTDLTAEQIPAVQKLYDALSDDEDVIAVHTSANL